MTFALSRATARRALAAMVTAVALVLGSAPLVPASAATAPPTRGKTGPVSVAYIEVNDNSMVNVGKYSLADGGGNVFDVAVIFAANINYDETTKSAYLHFNEDVRRVLDNAGTEMRPLQEKGIKVVLSVLGNHQGAGFANFPDKASASDFAGQLSDAVERYGLDGIDFDDEYAEYGVNKTGQPNASSFVHLVSALRANMPDKLITLYNIGESAKRLPTVVWTSPPCSTTHGIRTTAGETSPNSVCRSQSSLPPLWKSVRRPPTRLPTSRRRPLTRAMACT